MHIWWYAGCIQNLCSTLASQELSRPHSKVTSSCNCCRPQTLFWPPGTQPEVQGPWIIMHSLSYPR